MKILVHTSFLVFSLLLFTSCGKETLTPMVNPVTINELRNDQAINFSYKIDETQIDEYAKGTKKFPIFGKLFQAMAFVLANTTINSRGGQELALDPIDIDLNALGEIDFNFIDWISLDALLLQVENGKKKDTLEFIEKIEISAYLEKPIAGIPVDKKGYTRLVYYDRKVHGLGCSERCLNLVIEKIKWKELIKANPRLVLQPKLTINSVPRSTMALAGSVSFSVKFKLGF